MYIIYVYRAFSSNVTKKLMSKLGAIKARQTVDMAFRTTHAATIPTHASGQVFVKPLSFRGFSKFFHLPKDVSIPVGIMNSSSFPGMHFLVICEGLA